MCVDGILNLYKPEGLTSQTAVSVAKRVCGAKKAGHCGTLDPQAKGVLPVMLGEAVKASEYLVEHDKHYIASIALGLETDTEDITGTVLRRFDGALPGVDAVGNAARAFTGRYMQTPPMYSALKIGGKKLVDLARDGKTVEREPREVTVYSAEAYESGGVIFLDVRCSKGTYIRTLCADIGKKLGCGACMGSLERASVGAFEIESSVTLEQLRAMTHDEIASLLTPIDEALSFFPEFMMCDFHSHLIKNGCAVDIRKLRMNDERAGRLLRLYDTKGFFGIGIAEKDGDIIALRQKKLFFCGASST